MKFRSSILILGICFLASTMWSAEKTIEIYNAFTAVHTADPPPTFLAENFEERRKEIMENMRGDVALFSTSDPHNFFYATGFDQEPAIALLDPSSEEPFVLFVRHANPTEILWDGPRLTTEDAVKKFGADRAYTMDYLDRYITKFMKENTSISIPYGDEMVRDRLDQRYSHRSNLLLHTDLSEIMHEMRVIKDPWEQDWLAYAVEVTAKAHRSIMETIEPGQYEYQVKAEIEYIFTQHNCDNGFNPIVGSGPNATYLHYPFYDRKLEDGDLILIDVGARCNHYTADVTRTIPVNGKFSTAQRELYELVLKGQEAGLEIIQPGVGILEPHHRAMDVIFEGLYELGLITDLDSWWQKRFYVHYAMLHYIGLFVHDVGHFADFIRADRDFYVLNRELKGRVLEPGMVLTMEPGLYFEKNRIDQLHELLGEWASAEELDEFERAVRPVYEKYAGIGIRIEDDLLITEDGYKMLSDNAPRTVEEIEKLMKR
jgi:Xaa-Pro aminopeptidase